MHLLQPLPSKMTQIGSGDAFKSSIEIDFFNRFWKFEKNQSFFLEKSIEITPSKNQSQRALKINRFTMFWRL